MLDIRFIRDNPDQVQQNAKLKGYDVSIADLLQLDASKRDLQQRVEVLREQRNSISSQMKGGKPAPELVEQGRAIKEELSTLETELKDIESRYIDILKKVPNMADSDVPVGATEDENVVVKTVGDIPTFDFAPKNHYEIAEQRDWIDKERAAKVAGSRFAYIKGDLVKLQMAIVQFVMNTLSDEEIISLIAKEAGLHVSTRPFTPVIPPLMIRTDLYDAMDRLEPRDDRYKIEDEDLWLQGSAEHVLGSMHADEVLTKLRYRCVT